jgi:hypothetical protein
MEHPPGSHTYHADEFRECTYRGERVLIVGLAEICANGLKPFGDVGGAVGIFVFSERVGFCVPFALRDVLWDQDGVVISWELRSLIVTGGVIPDRIVIINN